jgi:hypothetical protein
MECGHLFIAAKPKETAEVSRPGVINRQTITNRRPLNQLHTA